MQNYQGAFCITVFARGRLKNLRRKVQIPNNTSIQPEADSYCSSFWEHYGTLYTLHYKLSKFRNPYVSRCGHETLHNGLWEELQLTSQHASGWMTTFDLRHTSSKGSKYLEDLLHFKVKRSSDHPESRYFTHTNTRANSTFNRIRFIYAVTVKLCKSIFKSRDVIADCSGIKTRA